MENNRLKNAIEFLMYSYFGLDFCDDDDFVETICKKAIEKAYRDATQQGAFNTLISADQKENADNAKNCAIKKITAAIKRVLETKFNCQCEYNNWHDDLCKKLVSTYSGITYTDKNQDKKQAFSYGNAQKWVNMTVKYLYTLLQCYELCRSECAFCKKHGGYINDNAEYYHVPVDSFIIEKVWKMDNVELPINQGSKRRSDYYDYKNPADHVEPWSKWDNESENGNGAEGKYSLFQSTLRDCLEKDGNTTSPIDWEGPAWIEIAKKRRNIKEQ